MAEVSGMRPFNYLLCKQWINQKKHCSLQCHINLAVAVIKQHACLKEKFELGQSMPIL